MRGYHPPDRQIQGCTQMCELEGAASCPAETTTEKCVDDCNVGLLFEDCSSLWDALFACAGSVSPAVCASNGQAVIADCAEESNAAIGCVLNEVTGGQWTTPCEVSCRTVSVELCPNTGSEDDCIFDCQVIGSAFSVCADAYGAALECTTGAELACDAEGKQYAPACAPLVSDFLECVSTEYDWEI